MGIFSKDKKSQGCVLVVGVAVEELSKAFLDQVQAHNFVLYQVNHTLDAKALKIKQEQHLTSVTLNLLDSTAVDQFFKSIARAGHQPELVLFQPQAPVSAPTTTLTAAQIEERWQLTGLAAISIAQKAIQHMLPRKQGTIIFLGSAHATVPASGWIADGAIHAGIRALSQSLAREFHPQGVHVSYVMLNQWSQESPEAAQAIADTCWHIYQQPSSAWSQELTSY